MHAVIQTGGKQYRVTQGERLSVERIAGASDEGAEVTFAPVLIVDGDDVRATPAQLAGSEVRGRITGETKGPKIIGFTYIAKNRHRRRWGHRQKYATLEITSISKG